MKKIHLLGLAFIVLAFLTSRCANNNSKEKLNIQTSASDTLSFFPNTQQGYQLKTHIYKMTGYGEDAERIYQESLSELKKDTTVNSLIFQVYNNVPEEEYTLRSLLVEALKELRTNSSLTMLKTIASSQIPEEKSAHEEFSTQESEVVIRITAIEGITNLAIDGNSQAAEILNEFMSHENMTVKQMAIRGYLTSVKRENIEKEIERIKSQLQQEYYWMVSVQPTDIKTVPHPQVPDPFIIDKPKDQGNSPKIKK